jgi:hypothetical protein
MANLPATTQVWVGVAQLAHSLDAFRTSGLSLVLPLRSISTHIPLTCSCHAACFDAANRMPEVMPPFMRHGAQLLPHPATAHQL